MRRLLSILACLFTLGLGVTAQPLFPSGADPIVASSGHVAAGSAVATLTGIASRISYLCSFNVTSSGSTSALVVEPTVTGLKGGTLTFVYTTVAGVTLKNDALVVPFYPCAPASGRAVDIVVTVPTLGAGNTNIAVNVFGYRL